MSKYNRDWGVLPGIYDLLYMSDSDVKPEVHKEPEEIDKLSTSSSLCMNCTYGLYEYCEKVEEELLDIFPNVLVDLIMEYDAPDNITYYRTPTVYSGFNDCNCKGSECEKQSGGHFRQFEWSKSAGDYTGNMRLSEDTDLIFSDDDCDECGDNDCDIVNLSCGCIFHKWCITRELRDQDNECPNCGK